MAEPDGMAVDGEADSSQLQARVNELEQGQLDADQAAHDAANRIAFLEEQLQSQGQSRSQDDALRLEVERLQVELRQRDQATEESRGQARKVDEVEKEKRELLSIVERLEGDKGELEASLQSLRNSHNSTLASLRQVEASLTQSTDQERSARLKLQTAQGELEIVKRDRDWHKEELEKGEREWKSWREDKHSQVTRLQAALESAESIASTSSAALEKLRATSEINDGRLTEAHSRIAELTARTAEQELSFRTEIDAQKRLVELLERRDAESTARLNEVEQEWQKSQDIADAKAIEWEDAIGSERARADNLATELETLREQGDQSRRLGGGESDIFAPPSRAGTPGLPGSPGGPSFALSPSASMAARLQKGGRSYTEVYSEYVRVSDELVAERAEVKRLGEVLTSILADIEARAPVFREQREEYERVTEENNTLAGQLARTLEERDVNERRATGFRLDLEASKRENEISRSQLSDLGRQVSILTRTIASLEDPSMASRSNEDEDVDMQDVQDAGDDIIPTDLLTFASVSQLVQRNQTLIRITRELSARMDAADGEALRRLERTENEAVKEAHDTILALKDELERQRTQLDAGTREREMLRRLVAQRGGGHGGSTHHGSINGFNGSSSGHARDEATIRELADVQVAFEAYKSESTHNAQRAAEDLSQARREAGNAAVSSAKAKAQIDFLNERLRTLNDRDEQKSSELAQLTKNIASLKKASAQQEQSVHEYSQQLIVARASVDKLEHEISNLRAERDVWKGTEARLVATNESLSSERGQLNDLLRTLQSMQNELESSGNAVRRRLEEDVAKLDSQLADVRDKLTAETEAHKQLALRREMDTKALQDRLDRLASDHAAAREEVLTTKNALEISRQKLDDATRQLAATQAKLAVYTDSTGRTSDPRLSREQQLQVELAEVKAELQSAKVEAEQARAHAEQYKLISQANEDALAELNKTSDEYRETTDKTVADKEAAVRSLDEQVKILSAEIESLNETNTGLHRQVEEAKSASSDELRQLQQTINDMREAHSQRANDHISMRDNLRQAEQRAADAHDKYERELVAHAEDVKSLSTLKEQLAEIRSASFASQTAAETATAKLDAATTSWARQREALQRDLDDTRDRLQAALAQNSTLHEHLEQVNATASKIKQTSSGDVGAMEGEERPGESGDKLQDIIRYLRREQEILNLQLHLDRQEKVRLSQKLEHTERSLDEVRAALSAERQRSSENTASAAQHAELLEKVNTLNVLRESNATLREDSEGHARKAASLETRLREVEERDVGLRSRVRELEAELETREATLKLVEEEAGRWKARTTQILEKYERIDPAEHQTLKDRVAALEQTNTELEAKMRDTQALTALQTELDEQRNLVTELNATVEAKTKEVEVAVTARDEHRERFRNIQRQAREQRDRANALTGELEAAKSSLAAAEERLAVELAEAGDRLANEQAAWAEERTKLVTEAAAKPTEPSADHTAELAEAKEQLAAAETRAGNLERQLEEAKASAAEAVAAAAAAKAEAERAAASTTETQVPSAEAVAAEVQRILAEASVATESAELSDEERQQRATAAEAALKQEREQAIAAATSALRAELEGERAAAVEAQLAAARAETEKATAELTTRLTSEASTREQTLRQDAQQAVKRARDQAKAQAEAAVQAAKSEAATALQKLQSEHAAALEQAKSEASASSGPAAAAPADIEAIVKERVEAKEAELNAAKEEVEKLKKQTTMLESKVKIQGSQLARLHEKKNSTPSAGGVAALPPLPVATPKKPAAGGSAQSPPSSTVSSPVPSSSRTAVPSDGQAEAGPSTSAFSIAGRATAAAGPASPTPSGGGPSTSPGAGRGRGQAGRGGAPSTRGRRPASAATSLLGAALGGLREETGTPPAPGPGGATKRPHAGSSDDPAGGEGSDAKRQKGA